LVIKITKKVFLVLTSETKLKYISPQWITVLNAVVFLKSCKALFQSPHDFLGHVGFFFEI